MPFDDTLGCSPATYAAGEHDDMFHASSLLHASPALARRGRSRPRYGRYAMPNPNPAQPEPDQADESAPNRQQPGQPGQPGQQRQPGQPAQPPSQPRQPDQPQR